MRSFLIVLIAFLLPVLVFRQIFLHPSTHLSDWNDYPFVVWTIYHHVSHISSLSFDNYFTSNIYYPYQGTLLFSDLFLPQGVVASVLSVFSDNPVLVFNFIFLLTLLANALSALFFWRALFLSPFTLLFATVATCASGFFFMHSVHFQILSFWPFCLSLGILFRQNYTRQSAILFGSALALLFLSSVYLAVFALTASALWYVSHFRSKNIWRHALLSGLVFLLIAGPVAYKYLQVKRAYGIERKDWEYVFYSTHLTDYIFSTHYKSIVSSTKPLTVWNSYNRANSLFPGAALLILALISLFAYKKYFGKFQVVMTVKKEGIFFLSLLIFGFCASLGTRLNVNGSFVIIPLPYLLLQKIVPLFDPIRVNSRWAILVFVALIYFASLTLEKVKAHQKVLALAATILLLAEVAPLTREARAQNYYPTYYETFSALCRQRPRVLLEYPLTMDREGSDIVSNLTYRTQMMLASVKHKCILVNGYMGYSPQDYDRYEAQLQTSVKQKNGQEFTRLLREKKIELIKFNARETTAQSTQVFVALLSQMQAKMLLSGDGVQLFSLSP